MIVLGRRLRQLLQQKDMTQRDLARKFGWSDATVSYWLSEERQPDLNTIQQLADFFDVTIDYLLGRTNDPTGMTPREIPGNWEEVVRNLVHQGISPADVERAVEIIKAAKKMREG